MIYDETLGLEDRARYYDKAGALIDMIQSHLLQVLAVLAMEPPSTLGAARPARCEGRWCCARRGCGTTTRSQSSRRARYTAGTIDGKKLPAYVDEARGRPVARDRDARRGHLPDRHLALGGRAVHASLGQGARGAAARDRDHLHAGAARADRPAAARTEPTQLRLMFAPDSMSLELNINGTGRPVRARARDARRPSSGRAQLLAYGEVLAGILDGDPSLSVRGDTAVECWRIVEPVLKAWRDGQGAAGRVPGGLGGPEGLGRARLSALRGRLLATRRVRPRSGAR